MNINSAGSETLSQGLKSRHIRMLSIAGVIGAGLFVGSGHAIAEAGPAVIIAYIVAGALVVLIMRMLAEMAVNSPDSGSFSTYASKALGRWAGFTIGWLYWWFWVLVIPLEAIAAGTILNHWLPQIAIWQFTLIITILLTISNLFSVKSYGEFEFWLALAKIVAIVSFLALGVVAIFGLLPGSSVSGVSHLYDSGGFMPNGFGAVIAAILTTMFSFMGSEIVTIAAAESRNPGKEISRATNSVVWRICLFYIASILFIIALVPWNTPDMKINGSYQTALEMMNIPHARLIVDLVVLTAVCSCLNSALYTASRMLFSLSQRHEAPAFASKINSQGTPWVAVILSTATAFLAVAANYIAPAEVFNFLLASSGAIALLVYLVIACSQLMMRKRIERQGKRLDYKMWLYPGLTYAVITIIALVLITMAFSIAHRLEILATSGLTLFVIIIGLLVHRRQKQRNWKASTLQSPSS